ncbi:C6 transcription factor [Aaosphaeria arxii CBS 175.79]|uniref:C6 transcription factor n=1 Tax=Aaosphaeria arxii CBS 175.79 TaxID=1450172 RepID=A0A6A5XPQ5_9PLEO|nr:C6 transcription factor [Aaosphaeria arxii CBS 175.79]KAF2015228.1 C6 transcription factor [Aaosphaeria arxii CBS 175.79]
MTQRSSVACSRCRRRKTKCTGNPPQSCNACIAVHRECTYLEAPKKVLVSESYLLRLRAQARSNEHSEASRNNLSNHVATAGSDMQENLQGNDEWWYDGSKNILMNAEGEQHSIGASSSTHLVMRMNPSTLPIAYAAPPLYDVSCLSRSSDHSIPDLPPIELCKQLFQAQHVFIGSIFSSLHPDDFYQRLDYVHSKELDLTRVETRLTICQVLVVLSLGQLYSINQWTNNQGPPGFSYFQSALDVLPAIHERPSLQFIEVLAYVAYYMQNLNRPDAAFIYIGVALRMALSLGLHQEVAESGIDSSLQKRRTEVWWSLYSLDRILSIKSGHAITIRDEDITLPFPTFTDSPCISSRDIILVKYTELARLLGKIGEEIYKRRSHSAPKLISSIRDIINSLSDWLQFMPEIVRSDLSQPDKKPDRAIVNIYLLLYSCIALTTRPLLYYIIRKFLDSEVAGVSIRDWKVGLSENVVFLVQYAVEAAIQATALMGRAQKFDMIATYGYLEGEYAFSATLLLIMANAALSSSGQTETSIGEGLGILKGMADRGNHLIRARHQQLLSLQASLQPRDNANGSNDTGIGCGDGSSTYMPNDAPSLILPQSFHFSIDDDPQLWVDIANHCDVDLSLDSIGGSFGRQ